MERQAQEGRMTNRVLLAILSFGIGWWFLTKHPFPDEHPLLQLVSMHKPALCSSIRYGYLAMAVTTPFITLTTASSLAYIFLVKEPGTGQISLPPGCQQPKGTVPCHWRNAQSQAPSCRGESRLVNDTKPGSLCWNSHLRRNRFRQDKRMYVSVC